MAHDTDGTARQTELVGRAAESAILRRALSNGRVTSVVGPIGVGKTALVEKVVGPLLRAPRSRAVFVRVRDLLPGETLLEALARDYDTEATLEKLCDASPGLVVLDGCEDRIDEVRTLAAALQNRSESVRLLITSTLTPGVAGETLVPVHRLPPVAIATSPNSFALQDAVRVFELHAKSVDPYLVIRASDEEVVAAICNRCGGMPLLLRAAGLLARGLSFDQLAAIAISTLTALGTEPADCTNERIAATIAGLDPISAVLLACASRIPGQATLELLHALYPGELSERELTGAVMVLTDASLLVREKVGDGAVLDVPVIVRAHMIEHDVLGPVVDAVDLGHYYRVLARSLEREWMGPRQGYWQRRMSTEWPMLRQCVVELAATPAGARSALDILIRMRLYAVLNNLHRDMTRLLELVLAGADPVDSGCALARAHLAYYLVFLGHVQAAQDELRRARMLAEGSDVPSPATDYAALAESIVSIRLKDYDASLELLFALNEGLQHSSQPPGVAMESMFMSAFLLSASGEHDQEAAAMVAAIDRLSGQLDSRWGHGLTNLLRGLLLIKQQNLRHATVLLEESLRELTSLGDAATAALALELLSGIEATRGEYVRAVQYFAPAQDESIFFRHIFRELTSSTESTLQNALGSRKFQSVFRDASRRRLVQVASTAMGDTAIEEKPLVGTMPVSLSSRELEVARLVSLGHSNPRIANILVISRRTAEGHVQRILRKGGFGSRTEIGVWYSRQFGNASEGP